MSAAHSRLGFWYSLWISSIENHKVYWSACGLLAASSTEKPRLLVSLIKKPKEVVWSPYGHCSIKDHQVFWSACSKTIKEGVLGHPVDSVHRNKPAGVNGQPG
jgi:hypothetical protein